jgi:DNA polymerase III subunit delta
MAKQQPADTLRNFEELKASVLSGKPSQVYWIYGEESWYLDASIPVAKELVPSGFEDFNLDVISGREVRVARVIDACRTYPMMADLRVVVVRDFMSMFDRRKASDSDDEESGSTTHDELLRYLEKPNPTCVLFLIDTTSVPANTKLGKALRNRSVCHAAELNRLDHRQLIGWISNQTKAVHNTSIQPEAAELLIDISGNDLLVLSHELAKLAQYDKEGKGISAEQVRLLATEHKEAAVFDVKDALFGNKSGNLFELGRIVVEAADTPVSGVIGLNGYLISQYTTLWQIARLNDKKVPKSEIGSQVGRHGFYFDNLYRDALRISVSSYPAIFETLLDADSAIKGMGHSEPHDVLYTTLRKLRDIHLAR